MAAYQIIPIVLSVLAVVSNALEMDKVEPLVEEKIPCRYKTCFSFTEYCDKLAGDCVKCESICHQKLGQENYVGMDRLCEKVCPMYLERLRREKLQEEADAAAAAEAERLTTTIQNIVTEPYQENNDSNDGLSAKMIGIIVVAVLVIICGAFVLAFCIKSRLCDWKNILPTENPQSSFNRRRNESTRSDVTSQTSEGPSSLDHDQPTGATSQLLSKSPPQSAQPNVEQPLLPGSEIPQPPGYRQQQHKQEPHPLHQDRLRVQPPVPQQPLHPQQLQPTHPQQQQPLPLQQQPTHLQQQQPLPPQQQPTHLQQQQPLPPQQQPTHLRQQHPTHLQQQHLPPQQQHLPPHPLQQQPPPSSPPDQEPPRAEHQPRPIPPVPQTHPQQPHSLPLQRNQPEEALSNATNLTQNGKIVTRPSSDHQEQAGAGAGAGARERSSPPGMREILRMSERTPPAALPPENRAETEQRNKQWVRVTAAANDDDLSDLKMDDPDETSMPQTSQPEVSLTPSEPSFMPEDPLDLMESVSQVGAAARTPLPQAHGYNGASRQQGRGQGRGRGQGQGRGKR